MKTTKNRIIIKSIKILANNLLYCVVFVSAGLNCWGTKKKITTIKLTPREEELITTDEDKKVLAQPNMEEICAIPEQQLNIPQAGLESSNKTNEKFIPVDNGATKSTKSGQTNQEVNKQSQNTTDSSKKNTNEDKDQDSKEAHFDPLSNTNTSVEASEGKTKQDASLDQNPPFELEYYKERIAYLKSLKKETNKIKKMDKALEQAIQDKCLESLLTNVNNVHKLSKENQQLSLDVANGLITFFEGYLPKGRK